MTSLPDVSLFAPPLILGWRRFCTVSATSCPIVWYLNVYALRSHLFEVWTCLLKNSWCKNGLFSHIFDFCCTWPPHNVVCVPYCFTFSFFTLNLFVFNTVLKQVIDWQYLSQWDILWQHYILSFWSHNLLVIHRHCREIDAIPNHNLIFVKAVL